MSNEKNLREELFPDGMPKPEEFISIIANYIVNLPAGADRKNQNKAE